ncbi:MAG: thioredoxin family protein [Planctomycetota bacterium]|nr:MAG: thioredoxin family protein [Planctomycetota bacterium]
MKTKWILIIAAAVVVGAFIYTQSPAAPAKPEPKARIGEPAPDFSLKDTFGKQFTLSEFKGKIVVLEWINQQCPISKGTHTKQLMQKTYKKYAEKGVVWLAIDTSHYAKPDKNRVYAAKQGLAYPILHDPNGKVGHDYGARTTPHMYVIDKTGKLLYNGAIDDKGKTNYVAAALDEVLAGKAVSKPKTDPYGCSVKYATAKK